MGVLEASARIIQLGGAAHGHGHGRALEMRAAFEERTGAFAAEDAWFEERSRAFWCDAVTRRRFGREVEGELASEDRAWLGPLERAHRGLFRRGGDATAGAVDAAHGGRGELLVDVWSGAEIVVMAMEEESRAEIDAASGQLFDARLVGTDDPLDIALLPGAVFHPRQATAAILDVLNAAHASRLPTHDALDALLRMERTLRALSRVKAAYAYRAEALSAQPAQASRPVRRVAKGPR